MDTALGLALTPTSIAWVLADAEHGHGETVAWDEFTVFRHQGPGGSVSLAAHAAATVSRIRAFVAAEQGRLRGVGVAWSDEAAVEAALLLEALTARFDSVLPIRNDHSTNPEGPMSQLQLARSAALALEPGPALAKPGDQDGIDLRNAAVRAANAGPALGDPGETADTPRDPVRVGALVMLATGAIGLVVSSSLALALQAVPGADTSPPRVAEAPGGAPAAHTVPYGPVAPVVPTSAREDLEHRQDASEHAAVDDGSTGDGHTDDRYEDDRDEPEPSGDVSPRPPAGDGVPVETEPGE